MPANLLDILNEIDSIVWGPWLLALLLGTGIMLTVRLGLLQVFKLPLALRLVFKSQNEGSGEMNSFKALCTALAATVGTGNIVGVATAVKLGGPGALFWMWIAAFFGMATKYAECLLAVKYRDIDEKGQVSGGPMYYIEKGLGKKYKILAIMFAIFGVLSATMSTGTFSQVNAITDIVYINYQIPPAITGTMVTVSVAVVTIGGLKSISYVAEKVVPSMAVIYFITTISILVSFADKVPAAFLAVLEGAFTGTAATGGFVGAGIMLAMRSGIARGIYSNESGLGTAPIAAAAARTNWPAEQGLVSMTGTLIDTLIICSLTGLTLVTTGVWCGDTAGAAMTAAAFGTVFPVYGKVFLMIALVLFAFTTILGWSYYAERCLTYLLGSRVIYIFRIIYILVIACAPFFKLEEIWALADIFNGLMAFPNLIALVMLSPVVVEETKKYLKHLKETEK